MDVPIGRDKDLESSGLRGVQQLAVPEGIPPPCTRLLDSVSSEPARDTPRRAIVEEDAHQRGALAPASLSGGEARRPLGIAAVGGMLVSTFLTVIVVPVVYVLRARSAPAHRIAEIDEAA